MQLKDFMAGLEILKPYYDEPGYALGAEHDIIYLYATARPLTPEDVARLRELGWFQEGVGDERYSPDDSWAVFT
jgi:hypothetical protein